MVRDLPPVRSIRAWRIPVFAGAAVGIALYPAAASADVLQIGGQGGYEWVAGGPGHPPEAAFPGLPNGLVPPGSDDPAEDTAEFDLSAAAIHPESITQALDVAGPTKWRARVAELAVKYDISPALLEAVVWQESRWNELAVSSAGARGLTQLMPGTARQLGVNASDPLENLEGGARYLRMQLDAFDGDIEKALAAYNAGPARVVKAGGIPDIRETKAYVASIMARLADPVRE